MASKLSMKNELDNEFSIVHNDNNDAITIDTADLSKVITIDSLKELKDKVGGNKHKPKTIWVSGYHEKGDGAFGSHIFEFDPECTEPHNGGTIIDPDAIFPTNWNDSTQVDNWYNYNSSKTGRFKLKYNGAVNIKWFGAKNGIDSTLAINSAFKNENVFIPLGIYKISNKILINNDINITGNSPILQCNDVSLIDCMLDFKYSAKITGVNFVSLADVSIVETSAPGDFIWFDHYQSNRDITLIIDQCSFTKAKNDAISTGLYNGTGNNVRLISITNCIFEQNARYDITIENSNKTICCNNFSNNSSGFIDCEPSGETNMMKQVVINNNIINNCKYNAIQASASNPVARGEAIISNNTIMMNIEYDPSVAPKSAINVRTNKASISNNTMNGGYDRLMDISNTMASINNNVGSIDAGEKYEYIKLANSSVASISSNIFNANGNLINSEINNDNSSSYTSVNTSFPIINLGNSYEQVININGNNGLKSRAFLNIGNLNIDASGIDGSEYVKLKARKSGNIAIYFDNNGYIRFLNVPTSSDNLPSGSIWNDSGTLKIV